MNAVVSRHGNIIIDRAVHDKKDIEYKYNNNNNNNINNNNNKNNKNNVFT